MSDQFLGEIRMVGFNFAPVGWLQCNGQILSISQYAALFALLGTQFGGNGTSTFGLPNLQGRVPVHQGTGAGSTYVIGELTGSESVTLNASQMPTHTHLVNAQGAATNQSVTPLANYPGGAPTVGTPQKNYSTSQNGTMNAAMIATAGGSQPFSVLQPLQVVNFIIATVGIFPSRN